MLSLNDTMMIADIAKELSNAKQEYVFEHSHDPRSIATADAAYMADKCERILTDFFANNAK